MFDSYNDLIQHAFERKQERILNEQDLYFEGHHIVLKSEGGAGESCDWNHFNIVPLLLSEHIEAHYLKALEHEHTDPHKFLHNLLSCSLIINSGKARLSKDEIKLLLQDQEHLALLEQIKQKVAAQYWVQTNNRSPNLVGLARLNCWKQDPSRKWKQLSECPICGDPNSKQSFACCLEHEKEYIQILKQANNEVHSKIADDSWKKDSTLRKQRIGAANKLHTGERCWITDGTTDKVHFLTDPIPDGWTTGRSNLIRTGWTEEQKQQLKGKIGIGIYINKEGVVRRIKPEELQSYLDQGWIRGNPNAAHNSKGTKQNRTKTIWIYNDQEQKQCSDSDLDSLLQQGWIKGRRPMPENVKQKIKHTKTGTKLTEEHRRKIGLGNHHAHKDANQSCWMYNPQLQQSKQVLKTDVETQLASGWILGRKIKWD